jgi:hypothetical protein
VLFVTSSGPDPFDGTLDSWEDVEEVADWDAVVLGNGASINVWNDFQYGSLFEKAKQRKLFHAEDEALFAELGVENFEEVLHSLSEAIRIGEALGQDVSKQLERHASIQKALARAVQAVHVQGGEIPLGTLEAIREELRNYRHVFTTSYDLLIYWAAAKGEYGFQGFYDFFWVKPKNSFDESTIRIQPSWTDTRLYFLHGALHLVVLGDGTTCKRQATMFEAILDQFGQPYLGDHTARPLVVTEARASDKRRSIEGNDYLDYCWRLLHASSCPMVIFGHSLSEQDAHLVDALNEHRDRPIAVGLRDKGKRTNRKEQHRIASLLEVRPIYFFNSTTHPLGSEELRMKERPWRRFMRSSNSDKAA